MSTMHSRLKTALPIVLALVAFTPLIASAHEPRLVESHQTAVTSPNISKAYYGKLTGVPDIFTIDATAPFDLYVNILVPYIAGQTKDVSATVFKDGAPLTTLDGPTFNWTKMFEPFGHDMYWQGPEFRQAQAAAGIYTITVSSPNNDSKYVVAVGETENFDFKETMNAITLVPQLKAHFFNESPISFILSPFGIGLIIVMYVLGALVVLVYRYVQRQFAKTQTRTVSRNIGASDRLIRLTIAAALLLWAITTTWSPFLLFLSGFAFFEGIFSWCGLYAALGRNTCPVG